MLTFDDLCTSAVLKRQFCAARLIFWLFYFILNTDSRRLKHSSGGATTCNAEVLQTSIVSRRYLCRAWMKRKNNLRLDPEAFLLELRHRTGTTPYLSNLFSIYILHCHIMFILGPKWYLSIGIYIPMAGQISRESSPRATHRPRGQIFSTIARYSYVFDQLSSSSQLRMLIKRWDLTRTMRVLRKLNLTSVWKRLCLRWWSTAVAFQILRLYFCWSFLNTILVLALF